MPRTTRSRTCGLLVATLALSAAVAGPAAAFDWLLPSSARWPGLGGAFFTTDLHLTNRDTVPVDVTLKFFRHGEDGTFGPEVVTRLRPGESATLQDVLSTVFGFSLDWGAIRVSSSTPLLLVASETSTKAAGSGTYGQSVPGFTSSMLLGRDTSGTIAGIRHDGEVRTNLVLANAIDDQIVVHGELFDAAGARVGSGRDWVLPPFGMTQSTSVVEEIGGAGSTLAGGRILLSTDRGDVAFAAYASVIDRRTNDPRTLLPATPPEPTGTWVLPSSAHAPGAAGAFFTTDLTLANTGSSDATVTLRFLSHDEDGTNGPRRDLALPAGASTRVADVLGSLFGVSSGYGALLVSSSVPTLAVTSETSTPAPAGGTYGQSVPAFPDSSLIRPGSPASIGGIRENASFRTNLVLANPTALPVTVHVELRSAAAVLLGAVDVALAPLSMTQVGRVGAALAGAGIQLADGRLDLSTATSSGAFAAYATVIDNATNDPRTLLP